MILGRNIHIGTGGIDIPNTAFTKDHSRRGCQKIGKAIPNPNGKEPDSNEQKNDRRWK